MEKFQEKTKTFSYEEVEFINDKVAEIAKRIRQELLKERVVDELKYKQWASYVPADSFFTNDQ